MRFRKYVGIAAIAAPGLFGTPAAAAMNPKAAIITVPMGVMGDKGHHDFLKGEGHDPATVELYSGGVLIYTETNPTYYLNGDNDGHAGDGTVSIVLTGNGTNFKAWYEDATTSWLNSPDLTVKMWVKGHSKKTPQLELFQPYTPVASAIWAQHAIDGAASVDLDAEVARAKAAETQLGADLAAERAARTAGDTSLAQSLSGEATRAQAAESALSSSLAVETASRKAADTGLQASIDGLTSGLAAEVARAEAAEAALAGAGAEAARAMAAEMALQNGLDAEIAARKAGDAGLQAAVDGETMRAQAEETALSSSLGHEITRAKSAESTLGASLTAEVTRATGAEAAVATNLNNEAARATGAEASLQAALAAEIARGQAAEANVAAAVNAEAAARAQADSANLAAAKAYADGVVATEAAARAAGDSALGQNLAIETGRASAAEATLQAGLNSESAARTAGDAALQNAINAETARAQAAEAALSASVATANTAIANEAAARAAGDASGLAAAQAYANAAVNAESAARQGADQALLDAINSEASDRMAADGALQNAINAETSARANADTALTASLMAYTDAAIGALPWPRSCPVGQEIVSTGNASWACAPIAAALPNCAVGNVLVSTGGGNYACRSLCSGAFIDTTADANNCGGCGTVCTFANGAGACANSTCNLAQCNQGFLDCDHNGNNGCECGNLPNATPACNGNACGVAQCNAGFGNCNNNAGDGCEAKFATDSNNCGQCGTICPNNKVCVNGACQAPLFIGQLNGTQNHVWARNPFHSGSTADPITGKYYFWPGYGFDGSTIYEYNNEADYINDANRRNINLPSQYEGTYHASVNGMLYYNNINTNTLVRVRASDAAQMATFNLNAAGHTNQSAFNWGGYSDISFYPDTGNRLWLLWAPPGGQCELDLIDPNTMQATQAFHFPMQKGQLGWAFMAQGVLYMSFSYNQPQFNAYFDANQNVWNPGYNNSLTPQGSDYITHTYYNPANNELLEHEAGTNLIYPNIFH